MTYQVIYSSVSATPLGSEELERILSQAQKNNVKAGITGALVYADRYFLQILEGEMGSVLSLMQKISRDVRHEVVTVLQAGEVSQPAFADWDMAYVSATPQQIAEWAGLGTTLRLPEIFGDLRQDPQRAIQVTHNILAVLANTPAQQVPPPE